MDKIHSTMVLNNVYASYINADKTEFSFDVNLFTLLNFDKMMYDNGKKNKYFNLILRNIACDSKLEWGDEEDDRICQIQLYNLNYISNYSSSSGITSSFTTITNYYFASSRIENFTNNVCCTFRLDDNNPNVNLLFRIKKMDGGIPSCTVNDYGHISMIFDIVAVDQ